MSLYRATQIIRPAHCEHDSLQGYTVCRLLNSAKQFFKILFAKLVWCKIPVFSKRITYLSSTVMSSYSRYWRCHLTLPMCWQWHYETLSQCYCGLLSLQTSTLLKPLGSLLFLPSPSNPSRQHVSVLPPSVMFFSPPLPFNFTLPTLFSSYQYW